MQILYLSCYVSIYEERQVTTRISNTGHGATSGCGWRRQLPYMEDSYEYIE